METGLDKSVDKKITVMKNGPYLVSGVDALFTAIISCDGQALLFSGFSENG